MHTSRKFLLALTLIISTACGLVAPITPAAPPLSHPTQTPESTPTASANIADIEPAVLLFTIGMHIEPLGMTAQGFLGGRGGDYHQTSLFERHVQDIRTVAAIVEAHGGRMTIQAQSPFTQVAIETGNPILAELADAGHELALHFHEDAHLGKDSSLLSPQQWCQVMEEEIAWITQASGEDEIRYWSGGNLYPQILTAAACAGLSVNSDWKNPRTQTTPLELTGVNPWRPAGGTDGTDLTAFTQHDPQGAVIFLPEGNYDRTNFASMRRSEQADGDVAYFEYLKARLLASLEAAQPGKVNVFHFTIHPGEFRGDPQHPFAVIENFLAEVVDPLVASGKVQWATLGEMAEAYRAWEQAHPGQDMRAEAALPAVSAPATQSLSEAGYITFAVNVHDWTHPDESGALLLKLVDLFEKYGVRGDFYFTPEITRALAENVPEVIERFRNSDMTISYHVRPPHPLNSGFDQRLKGLDDETLYQTILDYETYALDLENGDLDRSRPGGYTYVAQVFGRNPVVASVPTGDPRIKEVAQRVYAQLGAQVTVLYHESGTKIETPLEYVNGLLVRPSDFSVTRVTPIDGSDNFWWNYMSRPNAADYNPTQLLQRLLAEWESQNRPRPPFITSLIHENNFYRNGEAWAAFYFRIENGKKGDPLPPPWDLSTPDWTRLRSPSDQAAILAAYEELVAYAAAHLQVVTSEDLVRLAG